MGQLPPDSGVHLVRAHRPVYSEVPQVVTNPIFYYSGTLLPQSPSCHPSSRELWVERLPVKTKAKKLLGPSAFASSVVPSLPALLIAGCAFSDLPLLADVPAEAHLVTPCVPHQAQLPLRPGPPGPIPAHPGSVPALCPGSLSLLPPPGHHLLALWSDQPVSTQPCWSLTFLAWFLTPGDRELLRSVESVLKDLPALFRSPVPEGSIPGVLLTPSSKSWKFAFLKFRALTLLFP